MKILLILISLIFSINIFASENKVNIGVLYHKIFTTKKEAEIGSKIWLKYMEEKSYFKGVNIVFYEDEEKIVDDFVDNKISAMISNLTLYFKNKKILDKSSKIKWIPSTTKDIYEQYYLIKNKESKITLDSLSNKDIYYKNDIGKVWIENFILEKYKKPLKNVLKEFKEIKKSQKLVFNVFFNKNKLSVINKKLYLSMLELNPQIKQKIQIIKKSKPIFFSAIGFTHKFMSNKYSKMLEKITDDLNSSENGIKLVSLIDLTRIFVVTNDDLEELEIFYKKYFKLKKQYDKNK